MKKHPPIRYFLSTHFLFPFSLSSPCRSFLSSSSSITLETSNSSVESQLFNIMGSRDTVAGRPEDSVAAPLKMDSKTSLPIPESTPQLSNKRDTAPSKNESRWNTKNLALRLAADFASASSAAAFVAPLISIIDKYVCSLLSLCVWWHIRWHPTTNN